LGSLVLYAPTLPGSISKTCSYEVELISPVIASTGISFRV